MVPSGAVVPLPSLSVKVGAGTVTWSPGLPVPSSYLGWYFSLSLVSGTLQISFCIVVYVQVVFTPAGKVKP